MNKEVEKAILTLKNLCEKNECSTCEIKKTCDKYIFPLDIKKFGAPRNWKIED